MSSFDHHPLWVRLVREESGTTTASKLARENLERTQPGDLIEFRTADGIVLKLQRPVESSTTQAEQTRPREAPAQPRQRLFSVAVNIDLKVLMAALALILGFGGPESPVATETNPVPKAIEQPETEGWVLDEIDGEFELPEALKASEGSRMVLELPQELSASSESQRYLKELGERGTGFEGLALLSIRD